MAVVQALEVRIRDGRGRSAAAATQLPLQRAARWALDEPALAAALGQLGDKRPGHCPLWTPAAWTSAQVIK